jgi:hypothetical protein
MKRSCLASLGLTLGLLVGSACAQDIQWRAVAPTPAVSPQPAANAGSSSAAVILRSPVAMTTDASAAPPSLTQTSFTASAPVWARAKLLQEEPLPLPVGPVLKGDKQPPTNPVQQPSAADNGASVGSVVSRFVGTGDGPAETPCAAPDCGDGASCSDSCCPGLTCCSDSCSCSDVCCGGCWGDWCLPRKNTFWLRSEYLLWTVKAMSMPQGGLVTINNLGAFPALGNAGTFIANGGDDVGTNLRSGGRFTLGFGLPCLGDSGFETTYFFLGTRGTTATFGGNGSPGPSFGRPFTEVGPFVTPFPGNQNAELVSGNNLPAGVNTAGQVTVSTSNEFWGVEGNFRHNLCGCCCWNVDFLWGIRYLSLIEDLSISENLTSMSTASTTNFVVKDQFHTRNQFLGGQIGLDGEYRWRRWFIGATGKLALGGVHQVAAINGSTAINGGTPIAGGLLAQPTNIGRYGRDTFAIVPELGFKLGYNFTQRLRGFVGYDVVYMSSVVRPGDVVDRNVNSNWLPVNRPASGPVLGPALPQFSFRTTDFWAQGACFGLQWSY